MQQTCFMFLVFLWMKFPNLYAHDYDHDKRRTTIKHPGVITETLGDLTMTQYTSDYFRKKKRTSTKAKRVPVPSGFIDETARFSTLKEGSPHESPSHSSEECIYDNGTQGSSSESSCSEKMLFESNISPQTTDPLSKEMRESIQKRMSISSLVE